MAIRYLVAGNTEGFVPETHIIGKATRVLFSIDLSATWNERFRWQRFMKRLA
ncbi:MAG: hypothetical protein IH593_04815 [Bacteroidales bacterium]|nr:hypothetical protein [Bacteroidales bacterium]